MRVSAGSSAPPVGLYPPLYYIELSLRNNCFVGSFDVLTLMFKKIDEDTIREKRGLEPREEIKPVLLSEFTELYLKDRRSLGKAHRTITTDEYALKRLTSLPASHSSIRSRKKGISFNSN